MHFDWHVYLSETGAEVSPPGLFKHVRRSLEPLLHKGQTLEAKVSYGDERNMDRWWPAEVVLVSGCMILLKWCIPNPHFSSAITDNFERNLTFWFDTKGSRWSYLRALSTDFERITSWLPPPLLSTSIDNIKVDDMKLWLEQLSKQSVSKTFFLQRNLYAFEVIKVGGYFECEHINDPNCVWPVKVLSNVGGRVRLSWFGSDCSQPATQSHSEMPSTFTLFYLHRRIHPLGWGKHNDLQYRSPLGLKFDRAISNMDAFLRGAVSAYEDSDGEEKTGNHHVHSGFPGFNRDPPPHEFKVGWKVEAVNPEKPYLVQPATIVKVFNTHYFLVELDDIRNQPISYPGSNNTVSEAPSISFVSYAGAVEIMPVNTSQLRGIHLAAPFAWPEKQPFSWTHYLTYLSAPQLRMARDLCPLKQETQCIDVNGDHNSTSTSNSIPSFTLDDVDSQQLPYCPPEPTFRGNYVSYPHSAIEPGRHSHPNCDPATDAHSAVVGSLSTSLSAGRSTPTFLLGMKLEMVVPEHLWKSIMESAKHQFSYTEPPLCTATVIRVEGTHLLWLMHDVTLHTDGSASQPIMVDARSTDLYPVGWAASFGLPIIAPAGYDDCSKDVKKVADVERRSNSLTSKSNTTPESATKKEISQLEIIHDLQYNPVHCEEEEHCPLIYINTKCYLGPFLCKANLELVPRTIGPGPITRVLHSLLSRLAGAAYKPIRVLRMLEADWASGLATATNDLRTAERLHKAASGKNGTPLPAPRSRSNLPVAKAAMIQAEKEWHEQRRCAMRVVLLKVRCPRRGVKAEAPVEVCCRVRALQEFCRQISLLFEACPHLIGLTNPAVSKTCENSVDRRISAETNDVYPGFPASTEPTYVDCPSFCASRLRSRTLDRLPGGKRRLFASLRPFGVRLPTNNNHNGNANHPFPGSGSDLRTRSAVAAAQNPYLSRCGPLSNGFPTGASNKKRTSARFVDRVQRAGTKAGGLDTAASETGSKVNCLAIRQREMPVKEMSVNNPQHELNRQGSHLTQYVNNTFGSMRHRSLRAGHPYYHAHHYLNHGHYPHSYHPLQVAWPHPGPTSDTPSSIPATNQSLASLYLRTPLTSASPTHPQLLHHQPRFLGVPHIHECSSQEVALLSDAPHVTLTSNPMFWSSVDLATYLLKTDCREMWRWLAAEAVDGQAFMLLTLPILHQMMGMRWEDAIRLARHVVSVKRAFVEQFNTASSEASAASCAVESS